MQLSASDGWQKWVDTLGEYVFFHYSGQSRGCWPGSRAKGGGIPAILGTEAGGWASVLW